MPRRKIVGGPEEIAYRLLNIIRVLGKVNGAQALASLAAVAGLAHLYKVELGEDFRGIVRRVTATASAPALRAPQDSPYNPNAPLPTGTNEPLTIQPPDGIFDGLGDNDEQD
jgi:hypothetical protein